MLPGIFNRGDDGSQLAREPDRFVDWQQRREMTRSSLQPGVCVCVWERRWGDAPHFSGDNHCIGGRMMTHWESMVPSFSKMHSCGTAWRLTVETKWERDGKNIYFPFEDGGKKKKKQPRITLIQKQIINKQTEFACRKSVQCQNEILSGKCWNV